jgi:hypothetical protein
MVESEAKEFLTATQQLWLLVAAVAHDIGHLGVNNQFLVETGHVYALTYNDRSPLENFHCASLFKILREPTTNIFHEAPKDAFQIARKGIVGAILATDMMAHHGMVQELSLFYEVNSHLLALGVSNPATVEMLREPASVQLVSNTLLHFSDLGNPMKPWDLCFTYAQLCLDEFFAQGDVEKEKGIPVQMLNDRDKVNFPNSQIGFIEFVILPLAEKTVDLFPRLHYCADHLSQNLSTWADRWESECNPQREEADKVRARVSKAVERCAQAGGRGRRGSWQSWLGDLRGSI